ncbi:hypothetical protein F5Y16DRAFT_373436 [Xylariaceae sp. FL0255]|nr:hypothetical protein F5Y16DRAFT_373436 [Xylariaceae sp. FL0255]
MAAVLPSRPAQGNELTVQSLDAEQQKLFDMYRQYVTTGPNASDTTDTKLLTAFKAELALPQGPIAITSLCHDHKPKCKSWAHSTDMQGTVSMDSWSASFNIRAGDLPRTLTGTIDGAFAVNHGLHVSGELLYDDVSNLQGHQYATIGFTQHGRFYIDCSASETREPVLARFVTSGPPGFTFPGTSAPKHGAFDWTIA